MTSKVHCLSGSAKNKKRRRLELVVSMQCGGSKIKRIQRALCSVEAIGKKTSVAHSLCVMWRQHEKKEEDRLC
jgi:hypothetical protein